MENKKRIKSIEPVVELEPTIKPVFKTLLVTRLLYNSCVFL